MKKKIFSGVVKKRIGNATIPAKSRSREIYTFGGEFIRDVRLAYTRATILTAVQKSEKDEKVNKKMNIS